ncbi:MAG: [protein-PII] uridylyltransferase [Methylococcales bacterium]|nr:[protein-PII] uridylyltransferase [Methylococcales bacterium]
MGTHHSCHSYGPRNSDTTPGRDVNAHPTLSPDKIFASENSPSTLKQIITDKYQEQSQKFDPQGNVGQLLIENAVFIDHILTLCWNHFLKQYATQLSLVATGGYGRNELFPNSDIDILILLKNPETSTLQDNLSAFSNFLWDIGLKPGQSVRTIAECIQTAKEDQTIMTSLLETRLICGNSILFTDLKQQIQPKKIWPTDRFFAAKMHEQEQRYIKYHDTAYNLEPNIKEGPGGLRDLQNISWVFKHHYNSPSLKELIKYGFFSESEYDELIVCRNTLWRIRFALHTLTNRCEDRLIFDYQRELANQFGFIDTNNNPDVEQFMQHYFKTVMELERMNEMLLQFFSEKLIDSEQTKQLHPTSDHFIAINGYLEVKEDDTFSKHPLALLEIFPLLQQHKSLKGVRASTIRLIRSNLHLINDEFRTNPKANQLFLSILKSPRGITQQLRRMNRYGILAAYLPCFANIVARMQYDLFHIYTVDAHTLFVLRNLRRFSLEKHNDELPFCNSVFLRISKPHILYLAALFHDIAKGMGGDHSVLGEEIAHQFCIQHKISKHDTKLITWLVRNHLIMSMTAQRKDISDPNIIHKFALQVGSIEYLNHLYLFTVADIRATNPSLWNSWKDSLLLELYTYTHSALHRGLQNPIARWERLYENKQEAKEELIGLGVSESTIQKTWNKISDDYFLRYSADEIAWHTIAIASTSKKELPLVILRPQNQRGSVEIFVYAKNENNIFSLSANTLDCLGLTILDARIITTTLAAEQYVLNSFQVLEQSGESIKDLHRELHICKTLQNNLQNLEVKEQLNIHRQSRQARHFPIPSRIIFHKDPLNRYTIIELITTDYSGLLATIGQAFIDLDIQLHDAKITTIGSRVEDMFYITDFQSQPITNTEKLETIKTKLLSILEAQDN